MTSGERFAERGFEEEEEKDDGSLGRTATGHRRQWHENGCNATNNLRRRGWRRGSHDLKRRRRRSNDPRFAPPEE
ncbi:hypothetical protein NE237_005592 [Protea cynaroides]|uniref:Uncharacterized protein n=1 Tax=Protea cynaroides TaxID=273540 RepID=A0A9Q0GMJ3_9MAGN|nr:hypothetical protein NE237_005592 [Protea cynaroides]